jgi:hypothetical protein
MNPLVTRRPSPTQPGTTGRNEKNELQSPRSNCSPGFTPLTMPPRIRLPTAVAAPSGGALSSTARRHLSTTPVRRASEYEDAEDENVKIDKNKQAAEDFKNWIRGPGENFRKPLYNEMNYISSYDRKTWQRVGHDKERMNIPFPLNPAFRSHPVLSEELKEEIYQRIVGSGRSVRSVSAELGVSLERVAAVVRLKAVEKQWIEEVWGTCWGSGRSGGYIGR